ncbi:hypothetical protein [Streptomyces beihaiensis]|uniref:Uncharacterized protein n=1 Tax=Streptomyces beihaiensis TaxID=2984495 RepID=A0ABT3TQD9_9ACTN|nr:hypothetical protein [Streptomyces beihaiensis]MCX3058662.1 hypothetical protein [Streptomyces beihaiensis]
MSTEGGRYRWRCAEPIRPDEAADTVDVFSPSGPGPTVERRHVRPVQPPPTQTAPIGGWCR